MQVLKWFQKVESSLHDVIHYLGNSGDPFSSWERTVSKKSMFMRQVLGMVAPMVGSYTAAFLQVSSGCHNTYTANRPFTQPDISPATRTALSECTLL